MCPDRDEMNRYKAIPHTDEADEREHFYSAKLGQAVDMRRLGDVLHQEGGGHKPLPVS